MIWVCKNCLKNKGNWKKFHYCHVPECSCCHAGLVKLVWSSVQNAILDVFLWVRVEKIQNTGVWKQLVIIMLKCLNPKYELWSLWRKIWWFYGWSSWKNIPWINTRIKEGREKNVTIKKLKIDYIENEKLKIHIKADKKTIDHVRKILEKEKWNA